MAGLFSCEAVVLGVLLLTSKGPAGAGFITLAATLSSMDKIPVAGLALLLGIESFVNQTRAVTNLIGNGIATVTVGRWEGEFDQEQARAALSEEVEPAEVQVSAASRG